MKSKNINLIRSLCHSEINREVFTPYLLEEIRRATGCYSSTLLFSNDQHQFLDAYDESPDSFQYSHRYFCHYLDNHDRNARPSLSKWLKSHSDIIPYNEFVYSSFYKTNFFSEILQPLNYYKTLYIPLKYSGTSIGILMLHRDRLSSEFNNALVNGLKSLQKDLSLAFSYTKSRESQFLYSKTSEYFSLDSNYNLTDHTDRALVLLARSKFNNLMEISCLPSLKEIISPEIKQFARKVSTDTRNLGEQYIHLDSLWGKNIVAYHGLTLGERNLQFSIQPMVPYQIKAYYTGIKYGLSPKQLAVCMKLVNGYSYSDISKSLHVEHCTVVDHINSIKKKLSVSDKISIILKLFSGDL